MRDAWPIMMCGLILCAVLVFSVEADFQQKQELREFHDRCKDKGGLVLNSTKRDAGGWVGCYSGVKEIENEG